MDRRLALKLLGVGSAAIGLAPLLDLDGRAATAAPSAATRPRFYLQIIPSGGMDAVYTTDPKTPKDVDTGIDVPYRPNEIVEAAVRFGPTFKPLARWSSRLAVVNMFRQNSANHQSGLAHVTRCKSHTTGEMPTLLDLLGTRRKDEAVGSVLLAADFATAFSPRYVGEPGKYFFGDAPGVFDHLDRADADDLRAVVRALKAQAGALGGRKLSAAERVTIQNINASAALFERAAVAPKFAPIDWGHPLEARLGGARDLQRALWLFEAGIARCVTVAVGKMQFDTHEDNAAQTDMTGYLAAMLDKLFEQLDARKVGGRALSEQIVVVIGSEIGRFPRLNAAAGKDHFPQAPYLLYGAPFKTGATYGATDRAMLTRPVSLATGAPDKAGHLLQIDDLGTTLLALDGASPEVFGYTGARLRFLEA